jgi:ABC-type transporter Mla subunit MlaD
MQAWHWAMVVFGAVVTGAVVVAVMELRATLRETREFLRTTGARLNTTLDQTNEALTHINHAARSVDQGAERVRELAGRLSDFSAAVGHAGQTVRNVAFASAAIVPAVLAAWKTFFTGEKAERHEPDKAPDREKPAPVQPD